MMQIPLIMAVEDDLSEFVLRKMIEYTDSPFYVGLCLKRGGFGYLKQKISGFNKSAKGLPFLVLCDLNSDKCAPVKINKWLQVPKHPNLLFRVAVREVEAWIMADRRNFSKFLGIRLSSLPENTEVIQHPKEFLISWARRSRYKHVREDLVPAAGGTALVGPNYNSRLGEFVFSSWNIQSAIECSDSLYRTLERLRTFAPSV